MTYDMASRITQLSFTSLVGAYGTSAYSYDFTNQLTAADHTGTGMPADESLSFDLNGNRTDRLSDLAPVIRSSKNQSGDQSPRFKARLL